MHSSCVAFPSARSGDRIRIPPPRQGRGVRRAGDRDEAAAFGRIPGTDCSDATGSEGEGSSSSSSVSSSSSSSSDSVQEPEPAGTGEDWDTQLFSVRPSDLEVERKVDGTMICTTQEGRYLGSQRWVGVTSIKVECKVHHQATLGMWGCGVVGRVSGVGCGALISRPTGDEDLQVRDHLVWGGHLG